MPRGTGVLLNSGMTWFNPEPGTLNSIEPGKRILWAPTPTIVLNPAGRPSWHSVRRAGGGSCRRSCRASSTSLDFGMGVQDAVTAPRIHCEGPVTLAEARLGAVVLADLAARGHRLKVIEENTHVQLRPPERHRHRPGNGPADRRRQPVHAGLGDGVLTETRGARTLVTEL